MASRLQLHEELCKVLGSDKVYFQPPESLKMSYPCIRYKKTNADIDHANNKIYRRQQKYNVIVIDANPDSTIPEVLEESFPYITSDTSYSMNNLHHYVYTLFY